MDLMLAPTFRLRPGLPGFSWPSALQTQ